MDFRKTLFDTQTDDPDYTPLPEDRPGGFNWGQGANIQWYKFMIGQSKYIFVVSLHEISIISSYLRDFHWFFTYLVGKWIQRYI